MLKDAYIQGNLIYNGNADIVATIEGDMIYSIDYRNVYYISDNLIADGNGDYIYEIIGNRIFGI